MPMAPMSAAHISAALLAVLALVSGCDKPDPVRQAAQDARDVAMVERMNREPFHPIILKPITKMDQTRYGLDKPGCTFRKAGEDDPLFIAAKDEGFMRIGGDLKRFSAKVASADLPGGARSTYVGLSSWVDLIRQPDAGTGGDQNVWPARLIVHDAHERVAYMADGRVSCTG